MDNLKDDEPIKKKRKVNTIELLPIKKEFSIDLTDSNALKKMLDFTQAPHEPFGDRFKHDACFITYQGKPIVQLVNPMDSRNYAYAIFPGEKKDTYAQIGERLAKYDLASVKLIAGTVLKMFRGNPINEELEKINQKIKTLEEEGENIPIKNKKAMEANEREIKMYQEMIKDIALISGAMACEGGRGHTGLLNVFTILNVLKHLDDPKRVAKFSPELAKTIASDKKFATEGYRDVITKSLFPSVYDNKDLDKTRIAVGYKGSQADIQKASKLDEPGPTGERYQTMLQRDVAYVEKLTESSHPEKNKVLKTKYTEMEALGKKGEGAKEKITQNRKFNEHAHYLFDRNRKIHNRMVEKIDYFLEKFDYQMCLASMKGWVEKGYFKEITPMDYMFLLQNLEQRKVAPEDVQVVSDIFKFLIENSPRLKSFSAKELLESAIKNATTDFNIGVQK